MLNYFNDSPYDAVNSAYPEKFRRGDFNFNFIRKEIALGVKFQEYLRAIFKALGLVEGKDFYYNKIYKDTDCRPDFQFIKYNEWIDAKLRSSTLLRSDTMRYMEYCEKLIIVFLIRRGDFELDNPKIELRPVKEYYPKLIELGKEDIIENLKKLEQEVTS